MIVLPAEITHENITTCLQILKNAIEKEPEETVLADAGLIKKFDTSALALLLELKRHSQSKNKEFFTIKMPAKLSELANLYAIETLLTQNK